MSDSDTDTHKAPGAAARPAGQMSHPDNDAERHKIPEPHWTEDELKRRRRRGLVIGLALGAMVLLFYVVTVVKLGANVLNRPL